MWQQAWHLAPTCLATGPWLPESSGTPAMVPDCSSPDRLPPNTQVPGRWASSRITHEPLAALCPAPRVAQRVMILSHCLPFPGTMCFLALRLGLCS